MKTEDFISLLSQDLSPRWRFRSVLAGAVAGGIVIAAILFFAGIGFRPDIAKAIRSVRFLFKFVVTISLAVTAVKALLVLGRPANNFARKYLVLAAAPALLACAATIKLIVIPRNQWVSNLVGHNAPFCLTLIPLLAIGPLACLILALRQGAPSYPGLAGAVAGLAASGIAATFYAANCDDDSPLFVITWYPLAILMVSATGYFIGRKLLRW